MSGSSILLMVLGLCAAGIILVLYRLKQRDKSQNKTIKERIRPYVDQAYREQLAQQRSDVQEEESLPLFQGVAERLSNLALSEDIQQNIRNWLLRAGMRVRPAEFLVICIVVMVVSGFSTALMGWAFFGGNEFLFGVIGFAIGWVFPFFYVLYRRSQRMAKFNDQLLDLITLMSNSLKAGYGFSQSLNLVADEADPPASEEFNRVVRENKLGLPLDKALLRLVDRMESEDLDLMVTAVLIQRQIGGNLSQVLDSISETIRERLRLQGQIRALTAQGRLGGSIISALPFVLGLIFSFLKPEMMYNFVTDPRGIAMICGGVFLQAIGIFFIWQIVNIET